jgi:hypothetical protein
MASRREKVALVSLKGNHFEAFEPISTRFVSSLKPTRQQLCNTADFLRLPSARRPILQARLFLNKLSPSDLVTFLGIVCCFTPR